MQATNETSLVLGTLTRVPAREVWRDEQRSFTPWLAEHLDLLSQAIHLPLTLEAQEASVGMFRADILAKDNLGQWALIENQLERTDHGHLGQILTYASGLDAATIIWIADRFTDEHRAAFDWLNKITPSTIRFFGVEIEVWRIDDSPACPRFSVVSAPNAWQRVVTRTVTNGSLDGTRLGRGRDFALGYYAANGVLPSLALIMTTAACSKTLASRSRKYAEIDLGLTTTSED